MISPRTSLVCTLVVVALGLSAFPAIAEVYRYVDDDGNSHFSDSLSSVPHRYRDQVADISEEMRTRAGVNVIPGLNQTEEGTGDGTGADADAEVTESVDFEAGGGQAMRAAAGQLWSRFGALLIVGIVLALVVGLLVSASILMLACKLAAPETPGLGRACAVVLVQGMVGTALNGAATGAKLALGISDDGSAASLGLAGVSLLVCLAAYAGVLSAMTDLSFPRSVWVTIVYCLLLVLIILAPLAIIVFSIVS